MAIRREVKLTKYRIDDDLGLDAKQETKDEITAALTYGVLED